MSSQMLHSKPISIMSPTPEEASLEDSSRDYAYLRLPSASSQGEGTNRGVSRWSLKTENSVRRSDTGRRGSRGRDEFQMLAKQSGDGESLDFTSSSTSALPNPEGVMSRGRGESPVSVSYPWKSLGSSDPCHRNLLEALRLMEMTSTMLQRKGVCKRRLSSLALT